MTAPTLFRRESADVQAMRLDNWAEMYAAKVWLLAHGVRSVHGSGLMTIYGPGTRMVARLGDWLTYDGDVFAVEADDGGRPSGHTKVEA